jgi:hypothetical protein
MAKAKRARQEELPGMENKEIKELQNAAIDYAEIRDERIELNQRESKLKQKVLNFMHIHKLTIYKYEDVEVRVVIEEETVKVKIKKPKEESKD